MSSGFMLVVMISVRLGSVMTTKFDNKLFEIKKRTVI